MINRLLVASALLVLIQAAAATAQQPAPAADFAGALTGGPDQWEVQGLSADGHLTVRSGPSTRKDGVAWVANGAVLRNGGCTMTADTRWCKVTLEDGRQGWAAGSYLREYVGPNALPSH